ncbi:MAG: ribose 5-phosphate isomerase B [Chitinophagaceae bacterium]
MKVIIASDHAGYEYKQVLIEYLLSKGFEMIDLGTNSADIPDDYPDRAADAAEALMQHKADRGILICGSAVGVSIAANKFRGIRAGVCHDTYSAHQSVEHDNVNILCLGERVIGIELAKEIALRFLSASFSGEERHKRRLHKIELIEQKNMK